MRAQIILEGMVRAGCFGEVGGVLVVRVKLDARFFKNRFFGRKRAREFVLRGELFGYDFAGFDVGLIEGVDPEDGACDRGRNFPPKEFLSEVVDVRQGDAHYRVSGFFKRGDLGILRRVRCALQPKVGEDTVVSIHVRRAELLAINRDDSLAKFASGFCDQLLKPRAQVGNSG